MSVRTVAVLSPGNMGHAVGRALGRHGMDVVTCLTGRSERTRGLAKDAGIRDVPSLEVLVEESDLILSILVPAEAVGLAKEVAEALRETGANTAFADCNAVSPDTAREAGRVIEEAGGRFIDAGIIGSPPGEGTPPRFYASGPHEGVLAELDGKGIVVKPMGGDVGRGSAIKMCYAAWTKGASALRTALLTAAELLGISGELRQEFQFSQEAAYRAMESSVPGLSGKAFRWVGEMEEIAATFEKVGVTPQLHLGAADVFRMVAASPVGDERPETVDRGRGLEATISIFADSVRRS